MVLSFCSLLAILSLTFASVVRAGTNEEGLAFLAENREKPGVVELPSGLQYKVLQEGTGTFHPAKNTPCSCHYAGTLIDGTTFDSSYDRGSPTTFAPNQVIKGWTEAMQLMVQGDKWELYIPSELGYGDAGSGAKIPGGSVLVFQMEILELQGNEADWVPALKCDAVSKEKCSDREKTYLEKVGGWDDAKKSSEKTRINKILDADDGKLKTDLADWMRRRLHILEQLVPTAEQKEEAGKEGEEL
jgi:FKBP-type peptidyl-prolyl cis-trans isomerase FklB